MLLLPPRPEMQRAFLEKDASYDGVFLTAVRTTGIFCRPVCPSQPKPENMEFFASPREALAAGYRPCLRCRPLENGAAPPEWVAQLIALAETRKLTDDDWTALGVTPERARRWFQTHHGLSFAAYLRRRKLGAAAARLREGAAIDDAVFDSGYESHSGFRDAFSKALSTTPGRAKDRAPLFAATFDSPLGPLVAAASEEGVALVEFAGPRALASAQSLGAVPGEHPLLTSLASELREYFDGARREFTLPLTPRGTPFQQGVWQELRRIPYGETISYDDLAARVGNRAAVRAVAQANGRNPISILIPCHRVIGKDGTLTGYGGGLWRKRHLLKLECNWV